jgi:hypothetical protein
MLLPTFRGRKVGRVRADARIWINYREAIRNQEPFTGGGQY